MSNSKRTIIDLVQVVRNNSFQVPLYAIHGNFYCKTGESLAISGDIPRITKNGDLH